MIIAIIGILLSATPAPKVEVQDVVAIVAKDFASRLIAIENEMVAYIPTIIASYAECCQSNFHTDSGNMDYAATNYRDNVLNWDCPIRGSPRLKSDIAYRILVNIR
jgi:hypothetical protein